MKIILSLKNWDAGDTDTWEKLNEIKKEIENAINSKLENYNSFIEIEKISLK